MLLIERFVKETIQIKKVSPRTFSDVTGMDGLKCLIILQDNTMESVDIKDILI